MTQQWEASERILGWREMQPGVYRYRGIENRGKNDYDRPVSVVTLEKEGVEMHFYAPASLYWDLNRRTETNFIKYEGIKKLPAVVMTTPFSSLPNEILLHKPAVILRQVKKKHFFWPIEIKNPNDIMAEENIVMAEVMNLLEAEPAAALPAPGPDIPALREQLAILVSSGKCKEAIGVNLAHEQVRRLEDKDVMKHYKRYETYVGARTTETLIESFLSFSTKALSLVVRLKDTEALQNELKNDYIITKELSNLSGNLALRCGRMLALANAFLITAKHVDFSTEDSRDSAGVDEVDKAKQSSANAE